MKMVPNAILLYVDSIERSTVFYESLFDMKPIFTSPAYVAYEIAPNVTFALWSRHDSHLSEDDVGTSELGWNTTLGHKEIDALFDQWVEKGAKPVNEPYDDVFGRTFVVADPDGHLIRVAPVD